MAEKIKVGDPLEKLETLQDSTGSRGFPMGGMEPIETKEPQEVQKGYKWPKDKTKVAFSDFLGQQNVANIQWTRLNELFGAIHDKIEAHSKKELTELLTSDLEDTYVEQIECKKNPNGSVTLIVQLEKNLP